MNVSHREKIMLLALLFVAVIAAGYYFVFVPTMDKTNELNSRQLDVQAQADEIQIELASFPKVQEEVLSYETSLVDISAKFYPEIIQEKLMLQVDDFIQQSGIVASVFSYSTQQGLTVTNYQSTEQKPTEINSQDEPDVSQAAAADSTNEIQAVETIIADAGVFSVNMQFSGSSDQLREFIKLVEESGRAVRLSDLTYQVEYTETETATSENPVSTDTEQAEETIDDDADTEVTTPDLPDVPSSTSVQSVASGIKGSFIINFYSIDKVFDQDADYYKW
ncbi:MAG: hypothetical protein GX028_03245 [Clostridiaceae bacterium]|nr:hypothetical protein [Clostridiaceae bacterium]